MKQTIELGAKDIQKLLAKEFGVKAEQVFVLFSKVCSGYGIDEHKDYEIYTTVNK